MNLPVQDAHLMPSFLYSLAQSKNSTVFRNSLFETETDTFTRDQNLMIHFQGFQFSSNLAKDLASGAYGIPDLHSNWHAGLGPGIAMHRNPQDVHRHRRTQAQLEEFGHSIGTVRLDDSRIRAPVPTPPRNYHEFLTFLHRYDVILKTWLTENCDFRLVIQALLQIIYHTNHEIQHKDRWYSTHGLKLIWKLVLRLEN
jgi:hypothetical protein